MKMFMRNIVEREFGIGQGKYILSCGCRVASLNDGTAAKWVEWEGDGAVTKYGVVCEECFYSWGCERDG